jgi:septal ring factor EnvC (AmiA/AmiB activator)
MCEPSLLERFRSRWLEIARRLWPATPREQLESKLAAMDVELARRQDRLLYCRKRIDKLHDCLKRQEQRLALLASAVQRTPGEGVAVAGLERQRRLMHRLHERLHRLEHGYIRRLARLRERKQRWTELRELLVSGSVSERIQDNSDPDYPF